MHIFQPHPANVTLNFFQVLINRVAGKVKPQRFPFAIQLHLLRPRRDAGVRFLNLFRLFRQYAKHIRLANRFRFRVLIGRF